MSQYIIVNFDRKEYLRSEPFGEKADLRSVVSSYDGVLLGLAVLLADGNGRGGGDLRSESAVIGTWTGCRVAIVDETVCDAELSEPGMEHIALREQALRLGRDVSAEVVAAIADAEGEYTTLSMLNPNLALSLPEQRALPGRASRLWRSHEARTNAPLHGAEDVFNIFGVQAGLTPFMARKRLEQGLAKMAALFSRSERYEVASVAFVHGLKEPLHPQYGGRRQMGIVTLTAQLRNAAEPGAEPFTLTVTLGRQGSTLAQVYEAVFPGLVLERVPAIAANVQSPEVRKLLGMIPNLGA